MIRLISDPQRWALLWLAGHTGSPRSCTQATWRALEKWQLVKPAPGRHPWELTDRGELAAEQLAAGAPRRSRGRFAVEIPSLRGLDDDPVQQLADSLPPAQVQALRTLGRNGPVRPIPVPTRQALNRKELTDNLSRLTGLGRRVLALLPSATSGVVR